MYEGEGLCRSQAGETLLQQPGLEVASVFPISLAMERDQVSHATVTNGDWLSGVPALEHLRLSYPRDGLASLTASKPLPTSSSFLVTVPGAGWIVLIRRWFEVRQPSSERPCSSEKDLK